jgi:hypothetical protein
MPQSSLRQPDRLDRTLSGCDPAPAGTLATEEVEDALRGIALAIAAQPGGYRRRRSRGWLARPRSAVVVAVALVSLAGVAVAATRLFVPTYTHTYPPRWAIRGAGPGEILSTRGTSFERIAVALAADIPYPSGYASSWRDLVLNMNKPPYTWRVPSGQIRGEFAMSAICAWVIDWRRATRTGDRARASHDAAVLTGALHWSAVTAWDPQPRVAVPGDMGSVAPSKFGWAIPYIDAVRTGDLTEVDRLLAGNYHSGREDFYGNFLIYTPGYDPPLPGRQDNWVLQTGARMGPGSYLRYLTTHGLS